MQFLEYDEDDFGGTDKAYLQRTAAYHEIASPVVELLYDDKTTHYIQLFKSYDNIFILERYKKECVNLRELQFKKSFDECKFN